MKFIIRLTTAAALALVAGSAGAATFEPFKVDAVKVSYRGKAIDDDRGQLKIDVVYDTRLWEGFVATGGEGYHDLSPSSTTLDMKVKGNLNGVRFRGNDFSTLNHSGGASLYSDRFEYGFQLMQYQREGQKRPEFFLEGHDRSDEKHGDIMDMYLGDAYADNAVTEYVTDYGQYAGDWSFKTVKFTITEDSLPFFDWYDIDVDEYRQKYGHDNGSNPGDISAVPLPAGAPLLLGALGLLGFARRRRD